MEDFIKVQMEALTTILLEKEKRIEKICLVLKPITEEDQTVLAQVLSNLKIREMPSFLLLPPYLIKIDIKKIKEEREIKIKP